MIKFNYRNHREEIAKRSIIPTHVAWLDNDGIREYGYEPGLFLSGYDLDKQAYRSFRFDRIIPLENNAPIINFDQYVDRDSIKQLTTAVRVLVESVKKDEHGTPIGRFQDGNGGLVSRETHEAVTAVERLLDFYR